MRSKSTRYFHKVMGSFLKRDNILSIKDKIIFISCYHTVTYKYFLLIFVFVTRTWSKLIKWTILIVIHNKFLINHINFSLSLLYYKL